MSCFLFVFDPNLIGMQYCVENLIPSKEPADKTRIFQTLLKGQDLYDFEHHLRRRLEVTDLILPDNDLIKLVLRELDIGLEYSHHTCMQELYEKTTVLYMGLKTSVQKFVGRLNDLNHYLLYPGEHPKQLDQDEKIEILDQARGLLSGIKQ
jgi:hypothetical protein